MNRQTPPRPLATEEHIADAMDALAQFERDGLGHPLEDVLAWSEARRKDPKAPCPPPRKLR